MDDGLTPELRRMMVEYGEEFWGSGWGPLYGLLGGNPLAAMPSLHFATSVMAAHLLAETGPSRARSPGPTPARWASRSSTSASTTSSTSRPGSRSPRGSGAPRRPSRRSWRASRAGMQALEARARP